MSIRSSGGKLRTSNNKLRLVTPGATTVEPPFFTDFGLGMIGQSNMFNRQSNSGVKVYPLGHPSVTEYYTAVATSAAGTLRRIGNAGTGAFAGVDKWGAPSSIYGSNFASSGSTGDGPVMLSGLLAEGLQMPVRVINRAFSGSSIDSWISVANGGLANTNGANKWETFASAVQLLAAQLGTTPAALLRMVVWHQGETDAHTMTPAQWKAKLAIVHAQCKALAGNRADFLFGVYALGPGHFNNSAEGEFGAFRVAQYEYATTTPGAFFAGSAYDAPTPIDEVHIGSDGFHRIDRRGAKAALYALGITSAATGRGGNGNGPRMVGAAWDGSGVVLTFAHAGGNALLDGVAGTGTALTVFEFKDSGGAVMPYTSTAITGPTTVRVPMASKPATVSLGLMNVPCGTANGTSISFNAAAGLYDNDGYWQYGTTAPTPIGSPALPCASITVTGS